jgi:glycosyltransferase involved in cell wall biosynthesis
VRVALLDPPSFTAPYDHELAEALARRGHHVTLLTSPFTHGEAPAPAGYRREEIFLPLSSRLVRRAPRSRVRLVLKGLEYGPSTLRLLRRVRALRPDIVHVQWLGIPRYDVHWLRRLSGRFATVLTAHDVLPRRERNLGAWGVALAAVDRVVVQSERAVEQLAAFGVPRDHLVRVPHPVFPGPETGPPSGSTLLFFGLLREYKGLDVLIRALPAIAERVPGVRLVVVGDVADPATGARAQALAAELGLVDRVEWRLHFLGPQEIAPLMDASTLVVLPYRKIDSSGVLATALGHERPAIVTDVGGLPDPIREFGAGLVVPPDDPAALAAACVELLSDPAALEAAWRGTQAAREALTWDAAAEQHERLYRELVR